MKRLFAACLLSGTALLAACDNEPTGQVTAVVNGEEITLQEINAELASLPIPDDANKEEVQRAVLQRVVDRRLLAQEAREDGLDQSPDFLVRRRQLEDALLVQLLQERAQRSVEVPDERAIDAYVTENPGTFQNRTIYTLDRIQFPLPKDVNSLRALEKDQTMDAVARTLNSLGINFSRGAAQMDSAQVGEERLRKILSVPAGEPFVTPEGGVVTVAVITDRRSVPVQQNAVRPAALERIRQRDVTQTLEARLKQARQDAEITYQPGFAPDDTTTPGAASGATPAPGTGAQ